MGKTTRKSLYGDGTYLREIDDCHTVAELIERLSLLPGDLPVGINGDCAKLTWYNVGRSEHESSREHLHIEIDDEDDEWDDDSEIDE